MTLDYKAGCWIDENDPSRTVTEHYPEADVHVFRLDTELPPKRFSVEAGNIVHQLRSTLDNIVWQLVILNRREPRAGRWGNCFPILLDLDPDESFGKKTSNSLRGVKGTHRTAIQRLQPNERPGGVAPDENPIALLSDLSNRDKHQELQLLASRRDQRPFDWQFRPELPNPEQVASVGSIEISGGEVMESVVLPVSPLKRGAIIGWAIVRREGDADVEMKIRGDHYLLIDGLNKPLMPLLRYLTRFVIQVLDAFRPAFEGKPIGVVDIETFELPEIRATGA